MRKMATLLVNTVPLVEPAHVGGRQRPRAILLRTSWTTGEMGAANAIAQAWHNPNNRVDSCHYVVDEGQTLRCVPHNRVAFHNAGVCKGVISINVCHDPSQAPTTLTLNNTALLTARLCKLHHIPVRVLSDAEEVKWGNKSWRRKKGIILKTVGDFPAYEFAAAVQDQLSRL